MDRYTIDCKLSEVYPEGIVIYAILILHFKLRFYSFFLLRDSSTFAQSESCELLGYQD